MKYLKMLGLAAIAAGALMAFVGAGTASATELTCTEPAGTKVMCPEKTLIHAEAETAEPNEPITLHPPIGDIKCTESTVIGETTTTGSSTTTVSGPLRPVKENGLTFGGCNAEVVVLATGSLEIHTEYETITMTNNEKTSVQKTVSTNNGTLTSTGAKVTVTFLGFHCIFATNATTIGTLTGSTTTKATPTLDIEATIPRTEGRSGAFCGATAEWTGHYKVTTPDWMDVD